LTLGNLPILVVDDNRRNRELIAEMLEAWGAIPVVADGRDATIKLLDQPGGGNPFRLMLLDADLPDGGSASVAAIAQKHAKLAGEIALLTKTHELHGKSYSGENRRFVVTKPVLYGPLRSAIRAALRLETLSLSKPNPDASLPVAPSGSLRILVVEDNPTNR